jgi:hypothetical protein
MVVDIYCFIRKKKMIKMSYEKLKCQKCGRTLSLAGNEIGLVIPFRDERGTSKWGIFCANAYCSKLGLDTKISTLQNGNYLYRILFRNNKREIIDKFEKWE